MSTRQKPKIKVLAIIGPTATGKSALAVALAKRFSGEVISADSRQVYRGLDIGTGKITKKEMSGIPHYLLDVADPRRVYSATRYQKAAAKTLRYIVRNKKLPIVCGGTGFYIDTLLNGTKIPPVPANLQLRKTLEKKSTTKLFMILQRMDPERAQTIDKHNPVRLIRAIEIAQALGKVPKLETRESPYTVLKIGIRPTLAELQNKIEKRLLYRINHGMIAEAKKLHAQGLSYKRMEQLGLEYRYLARYLQELTTKEEMITELNTKTFQYAKRQITWFKRDKATRWFTKNSDKKIEVLVKKFLQN